MLSAALLSLLLPATVPVSGTAIAAGATADPPVRVSLDHRTYERGDRARVTVRVRDDGYLVVLQLDPDGRVRVLFPLDPGDDNFVRGGQGYEIRGRGDREAFTVEASSGTGTVYAAWSRDPFRFDDFVRGDHWDYRVFGDSDLSSDPETGLTNLVGRMTSAHFDYDLETYAVEREVAYRVAAPVYYPPSYYPPGCWWSDPWCGGIYYPRRGGFSIGISIGWPYYGYYDPFFYRPFYYRPFYYRPIYYHRCCFYRPIVIARGPVFYGGSRPYRYRGGAPSHGPVIGVQYRPRVSVAGGERHVVSPLFAASQFRRGVSGAAPYARRGASMTGTTRTVRASTAGGRDWRTDGGRRTATRAATMDGVDRPMRRGSGTRVESSAGGTRAVVPLERSRRAESGAYEGRRGIAPVDGARGAESRGTPSRRYDAPARSEVRREPARVEARPEPRAARPDSRRAEPQRSEARQAPRAERSGGGRVSGGGRGGGGGGGGRRRP